MWPAIPRQLCWGRALQTSQAEKRRHEVYPEQSKWCVFTTSAGLQLKKILEGLPGNYFLFLLSVLLRTICLGMAPPTAGWASCIHH